MKAQLGQNAELRTRRVGCGSKGGLVIKGIGPSFMRGSGRWSKGE